MSDRTELPRPAGAAYRLCFVCSGNICRSPMAAAVMTQLVVEAGLAAHVRVDSAGTVASHVGGPADPRAVSVLARSGYDGHRHRARSFLHPWLDQRDLVLALDAGHLHELRAMAGADAQRDRVRLLRSFDPAAPAGAEVADPYFGDERGFVEVLEQVERACRGLLAAVSRVVPGRV